jgi:hypothetical protein
VQTDTADSACLDNLMRLGGAGLVVEGGLPVGRLVEGAERHGKCVGLGLPPEVLEAEPGSVETAVTAWRQGACNERTFFACCRLPRSAAPEALLEAVRLLR